MPVTPTCQLARFSDQPCDGRFVRAHIIRRQVIVKEAPEADPDDWRVLVWACGGPMGNGGHHGMLDQSRTLRIPPTAIPHATRRFAEEYGLTWWLEREYGRVP